MENNNAKYNNSNVTKSILILFLFIIIIFIYRSSSLFNTKSTPIVKEKISSIAKEKIVKKKNIPSIQNKKDNFLKLLVEPTNKIYTELAKSYEEIKTNPEDKRIPNLKLEYKVSTYQDLLVAMKPHPKSIALAQAAMESAWGTSRFFKEANNIFGIWSFNKNEPRISAQGKRGSKTIWLRKYGNIEDSIRDYYKTISKSKAFKKFRELNYQQENQNPYILTLKLDKYSEKGSLYGKELNAMIKYNQFTKFD